MWLETRHPEVVNTRLARSEIREQRLRIRGRHQNARLGRDPIQDARPCRATPYLYSRGFALGTSPTRIMGEIRAADGKGLRIDLLQFRSTSSHILGLCGRFPGFRQAGREIS